jgi:ribosome biogenesis GTPase / thiamine phosphate phosphatase
VGGPARRARPGGGDLNRRAADLDEDDVRVRPGKGSRPRTRRRPAHDEAVEGFVAAVDRGRYRCWVGDREVTAMKARELGRGQIVVGDVVSLTGDVSGRPDTLARIVKVAPRTSALRRSADDTDPVERVIVANADQLVIVTALASPPPRPRLIDRFLVAAYDAGLEPLLCLTKADLAGPEELLAAYEPLGLRHLVTSAPLTDAALAELRAAVTGRVSVLVGQSGVGKSTLFNALLPDSGRATGSVNPVTGRGRHTSSSALALRLPGGGWIIDTPGLRSFGLGHISADRVILAFPDLAEGAAECAPQCSHLGADCGLDEWAAAHGASARLDSLRRLLRSREGLDPADAADPAAPASPASPADPGAGGQPA